MEELDLRGADVPGVVVEQVVVGDPQAKLDKVLALAPPAADR
jgi:hypothetical protein